MPSFKIILEFFCLKTTFIPVSYVLLFSYLSILFASESETSKLLFDISNGPNVYYSPEAYSFFSRKGYDLSSQKSREEAVKSFQATIKIAEMGNKGYEAVPTLISVFPRAIHVTEVLNVYYRGEGTFEDWVQTYVTGEKNKFILSSPFSDYATMSRCEAFITTTHEIIKVNGEPVTIPTRDLVNIFVVHTVFFGAYALSAVTGEQFGTDIAKWQEWWKVRGMSTASSTTIPTASTSIKLRSGQLFKDILIGGKYRMFLSTGDTLDGKVEAKNDTSLIIETSEGKAFSFRASIILRYEFLEPPKISAVRKKEAVQIPDSLPFTFEEMLSRNVEGKEVEVHINRGMVFRGIAARIDSESISLQVGSSLIPITKDVVVDIRLIPPVTKTDTSSSHFSQMKTVPQKNDTVIVKSNETDEWGRPKPDSIFWGKITLEHNEYVVLNIPGKGEKKIYRNTIARTVKHGTESYDSPIKRYAQPLFCGDDMFLVDMPPGKNGRPFFKVCVDRYEYPNVKGVVPKTNVSYSEADSLCRKLGKRLCTAEEWQWACSGMEGYTYPYGWNPEKEKCNTDAGRLIEPSGSRHNCISKFGGYDMVGNVFEWVTGPDKKPALMGGPYSKCQTITAEVGGKAKPQSGFRCCRGN